MFLQTFISMFQQSRPLLEGFCLRALSKKEHNGETWTPLRLEQSSTNEVIAKLLFCLKLTARAQQMDGWVSAFSFRSRVVTIRYVCITHSVIRPLQVIIGSCVGPLCLGLFFTLQSKVRFNQSHLMAPNGPKHNPLQQTTTRWAPLNVIHGIAITLVDFLLERVTTWGYIYIYLTTHISGVIYIYNPYIYNW